MWKMTIKQRKKHTELMSQLDALKRDRYLRVPPGYTPGENIVEDEKYKATFERFQTIVEELHALEEAVRDAT